VRILSAEAMAKVDRAAIEVLGIPSMVLMENAAIGAADAVGRSFPEAGAVAIFCGPGNNGGDGLAIGRQLAARGYRVVCFLVLEGRELTGAAGAQLEICRALGADLVRLVEVGEDDELAPSIGAAREADLVVDALFGTGLGRPLEGRYAELVEALAELPVPKLAVDLPSGLNGTRTEPFGPYLPADVTVTFGALKPAQVFPPAADGVGEVVVADLGLPPAWIEQGDPSLPEGEGDWEEGGALHLLVADEVAGLLAPRRADSHKGTYGHLLVVAGATGKAGAAILTAVAAVRAGAGLVTAAVPAPIVQTVDGGSLESMTLALPADEDGAGTITSGAADAVLEAARGKDAVALGPGLGGGDAVAAEIRRAVLACPLPLVLDADGINAFAGRAGELAGREAPTILTPHPGELARLLGVETGEVTSDRLAAVRRAARESGGVVALKGHLTLVAAPDGTAWVNPTGNPGLATGGTGDVLTGVVGALLARGYEPAEAACLGVYLHGLAGDLAAEEKGRTSLRASDVAEHLPTAFRRLRTDS
jgi:ADP-dependent NAD(P)H-hydrate dehydratase / NAD(P)H-hydrate epimerase